MKLSAIAICAACLLLGGCAKNYSLMANPVSTVNVPDRLKGVWAYSIDESIKDARRTAFKPGGHPCSLHTYNLEAGATVESAIRKAMGEFLESGAEQKTTSGAPRLIVFRLEAFQPRFSCAIGMTEGHCTGTAEIALGITIVKDGERKSLSVSAERTADAPGGNMCSNALAAPSEATRKAVKDVVERAMERIYSAVR